MPNPFKRQGSSYRSGDWWAWPLGLLAQLDAELTGDCPQTIALVGDIGSGKTTALDAYRARIAKTQPNDIFVRIDVGKRSAEQWTTIHRDIYVELVAALGVEAHDNAVKKLNLSARHTGHYLQQHEIFDVVEAMIQHSVSGGAGVHVLLDECQRPMEYYERAPARAQIASWFELLKNIAEAVSRGDGRLLITTTPSPWDGAPQHVRDRFVDLRADAPMAGEIQAFIMEGLKHVDKDKPDQADAGLGALVKAKHPALITPRQLHDLLWKMWNKARSAGASMLAEEHLP